MRLPNGLAWSVPVTLAVQPDELAGIGSADEVELVDEDGRFLGVLEVTDRFETDQRREARLVYGTEEEAHPGVASLYAHGTTCLAGPVRVASRLPIDPGALPFLLDPAASRAEFDARGWRTVVGFQTRNPIHRAHEYITKVALETVDGLLIHPLVGETKSDDIPADVRMRCYEVLIEGYYPQDRVRPGRAAGGDALRRPPRGGAARDPAQELRLHPLHRGPRPRRRRELLRHVRRPPDLRRHHARRARRSRRVFFEHTFWCNLTGGMATTKTSPSSPEQRVFRPLWVMGSNLCVWHRAQPIVNPMNAEEVASTRSMTYSTWYSSAIAPPSKLIM